MSTIKFNDDVYLHEKIDDLYQHCVIEILGIGGYKRMNASRKDKKEWADAREAAKAQEVHIQSEIDFAEGAEIWFWTNDRKDFEAGMGCGGYICIEKNQERGRYITIIS